MIQAAASVQRRNCAVAFFGACSIFYDDEKEAASQPQPSCIGSGRLFSMVKIRLANIRVILDGKPDTI
ncbi:hypothetical protein SRHO_G00026770 [Serrasalmus rhombeus]